MSAHSAPGKTGGNDDGGLNTILDRDQRAELTLLIANATEQMRNVIESNFKPSLDVDKSSIGQSVTKDVPRSNTDDSSEDAEEKERQFKEQQKWEKEASSPKMQELRRDTLASFDEWRDAVVLRVGEVVNSKDTASHQGAATDTSRTKAHTQHTETPKPDNGDKSEEVARRIYKPTETPLADLDYDKRLLILHSLLLLLLSLERYNAPSRVFLLHLASSLKLPHHLITEDEQKVAKGLLEAAKQLSGEEETKKRANENPSARKWKVGLASVAGAALIGVTGGLAAPLVAAGIGSVMGGLGLGATAAAGYLGTVAGSSVIVGGLFGAYGGRMTGQMMDAYAKEVDDFAFVPVHGSRKHFWNEKDAMQEDRRLRVVIGITGWLTEKDEVVKPWRVLSGGAEAFALRWELEALLNLGNSILTMVNSYAWGYAKKEIIKRTIFADLAAALWPIGLLKVSRVVDNPFSIAKSRADKAGEVLADALINKAQGERAVNLVGYSLGARVIYTCLTSLAKRKAFGLVESVVLVGAPAPSTSAEWRTMRAVVSGRLVNVYSENDYVLGFLYRTSSVQFGIAGLQPIKGVAGVENVDVSQSVSGHMRYRHLIGSILKDIGFEDVDMEAVRKEEEALRIMDEQEQKRKEKMEKEEGKQPDNEAEADEEARKMEREVQERTQMNMMQRAAEQMHLSGHAKEEKRA